MGRREVQHVPGGGAACLGLRQGSCHGAYVIRKWWEFGRHPHTPRAWNSRKGQRSTCLKLTEEKPESGGRAEIGPILPITLGGAELQKSCWGGGSPRPQSRGSIQEGLSPSNCTSGPQSTGQAGWPVI